MLSWPILRLERSGRSGVSMSMCMFTFVYEHVFERTTDVVPRPFAVTGDAKSTPVKKQSLPWP